MKATEFDRKFDDGEDMTDHLDWSKAIRPNARRKQVIVRHHEMMSDVRPTAPSESNLDGGCPAER